MLASSAINQLQVRKQQLLAESLSQRQELTVAWRQLRLRSTWTQSGLNLAQQVRPWLVFATPVLGYLVARRWLTTPRFLLKGLVVWQAGRRLLKFWRLVKALKS